MLWEVASARMFWIIAVLLVVGILGPFVAKPLVFEILLTVVMVGYLIIALRLQQAGFASVLLTAFGYGAVVQVGYAGSLVLMYLTSRRGGTKEADEAMGKLNSKPKSTALHD